MLPVANHPVPQVPQGLRAVPLLLAMSYLILTLVLFFVGPYDWPLHAWWVPSVYVPIIFGLLALGFLQSSSSAGTGSPMPNAKAFYLFGSIGTLLLLAPTTLTYTDRWPWEIGGALADQREAYSTLAAQLIETEGARGPLAFVRAIVAPFAFCVLPLAVIYWRGLPRNYQILAILTVSASVDLSILRGTTRELADLLIIGSSAYLISLGRDSIANGRNLASALGKRWKAIFLLPVILTLVLGTLIGRTEARLGGQDVVCIPESGVCLSASEPYQSMSDATLFGFATMQGYFSQGYYGLSLAGEMDFETTYGLGHSSAVASVYVIAGGDRSLLNRAYTARARADGWNDQTQWSTLLASIANDIGFVGAAVFIYLVGLMWGRAWINATQGRDDKAAVFFCALMMIVFYLPANNQLMSTFDGYATLIFWGTVALFGRKVSSRV